MINKKCTSHTQGSRSFHIATVKTAYRIKINHVNPLMQETVIKLFNIV